MTVARALEAVLGPDLPIAVRAYDGSRLGPAGAPATLLIRSPAVFRRLITAPGELGIGRAYVAGELDVDGDLYAALAALRDRIPDVRNFGARDRQRGLDDPADLEMRHIEGLREHCALTLRAWVRNLEANWDAAVAEVGPGQARVWRLYMAASALNLEAGRTQVHQVLAVRLDHGGSGLPLRPRFE